MTKKIKIGDCFYKVQCSPETAMSVLEAVLKWMSHPDHYSAHSGEGIAQSDNTTIDSVELVCDIVDNHLKPEFIEEANS